MPSLASLCSLHSLSLLQGKNIGRRNQNRWLAALSLHDCLGLVGLLLGKRHADLVNPVHGMDNTWLPGVLAALGSRHLKSGKIVYLPRLPSLWPIVFLPQHECHCCWLDRHRRNGVRRVSHLWAWIDLEAQLDVRHLLLLVKLSSLAPCINECLSGVVSLEKHLLHLIIQWRGNTTIQNVLIVESLCYFLGYGPLFRFALGIILLEVFKRVKLGESLCWDLLWGLLISVLVRILLLQYHVSSEGYFSSAVI